MVERVNGTIIAERSEVNPLWKNATIKAEEYQNIDDVKKDLDKFLIYYNFNRRHGSLKKELRVIVPLQGTIKVRTPFEAVQSWFRKQA